MPSQQARSQQFELLHELDKIAVSGIVARSGCDGVVLHQFCNVGDSIAMMEADIPNTKVLISDNFFVVIEPLQCGSGHGL